MSKMMKRGIFMFLLLLAVSIGIIYYTIDLDALKAISSFNSISLLLAVVALVAGMYFDGLRLQRLVKLVVTSYRYEQCYELFLVIILWLC